MRVIRNYIATHPNDAGIIYCLSRKTTEMVAGDLRAHHIAARAYHAGLDSAKRSRIQQDFKTDTIQVVCATIAFGMGIDKSNVRWIFHYNMPKSIESFYQEIGRAGRDGAPADTVLFYSFADFVQLRKFAIDSGQPKINLEKLQRMLDYAQSSVCRRRILLNYFGEETAHDCGNCDICKNPPHRFDGTIIVQKALSAIARTGQRARMSTIVEILRGLRSDKVVRKHYDQLKTFGVGRDITAADWNAYLLQMMQLGYFEVAYNEGDALHLTAIGKDVLYGRQQALLTEPKHEERTRKRKGTSARDTRQGRTGGQRASGLFPEVHLSAVEDTRLFELLRQLRMQLARQQGFPAYIVFSDTVLHSLATLKPTTLEAFGNVSGIGDFKKQKYGKVFTNFIANYLNGGK